MRLDELMLGVALSGIEGERDLEIREIVDDSRKVAPGDLFVAVHGETVDGHNFVADALAHGAGAVLVDASRADDARFLVRGAGQTLLWVEDSRRALATVAANRFGRPAHRLKLIGITGTNGKTTTNFLVEALIRELGGLPGVIGTVLYRYNDVTLPAPFTTPTPLELHRTLAEMVHAGVTHATLECSSHALALDRLAGVDFDIAAFTNLTQDHLDFHGTIVAYQKAKERLFSERLREDGTAVILLDNPAGEAMRAAAGERRVLTARARGSDANITARRVDYSIAGIDAALDTPAGLLHLRSPLIGAFNFENLLVSVGIGLALGLPPERIARALSTVGGVPGRLERVETGRGFDIFVDYAHTPDALERVMAAVRPLVRGRLIVVFGCGGDRDRKKRPLMGAAVTRDADVAIVTSDNPRTEDPVAIIEMIAAEGAIVEVDRRVAIGRAISLAQPGDVILIAGKGHEDYQIVGKEKLHFDDREEARSALQKLAFPGGPSHS